MKRSNNSTHTTAFRRRALALAAKIGAAAAGRQLGLHVSTLYTWRARSGKTLAANGLPTQPATSTKARALVPTTYRCPHCGGPVVLPGGAHA